MDRFFQVAAGVLLAVILGITLSKQSKDMALVLSVTVCCMVLSVWTFYLEPVITFVNELKGLGQLDEEMTEIVLKAVGIGLTSEIAGSVCADSGNVALGKAVQLLATAAVLWLSLPLMRSLVEMVGQIMGDI